MGHNPLIMVHFALRVLLGVGFILCEFTFPVVLVCSYYYYYYYYYHYYYYYYYYFYYYYNFYL